jgi:hypothetical protein
MSTVERIEADIELIQRKIEAIERNNPNELNHCSNKPK